MKSKKIAFFGPSGLFLLLTFCSSLVPTTVQALSISDSDDDPQIESSIHTLVSFADKLGEDAESNIRSKRSSADGGVTNLDIRDAILQLLNVIRDGNKAVDRHARASKTETDKVIKKMEEKEEQAKKLDKKLDNISTFLLRMNAKIDQIDRRTRRGGGRGGGGGSSGGGGVMTTLVQESFDILTLLPTYIENTKEAIDKLSTNTKEKLEDIEQLLVMDDGNEVAEPNGDDSEEETVDTRKSIAMVLKEAETKILGASEELKGMVNSSGEKSDASFEKLNDGYAELTEELKGLSNVEKVLVDTAEGVMETKRKIEFGVKQIVYKIGELVKMSGGSSTLKTEFEKITETILENQNEALGNLTSKVEKEIGQVWRQMGVMYGQVSNSIAILEKVKQSTEGYVNNTGRNLGAVEGQVEGLNERMVDVDDNLNYMLGQLKLVVQEFNQVKTNLGTAIGEMEDEIQDQVPNYQPEGNPLGEPVEERKR